MQDIVYIEKYTIIEMQLNLLRLFFNHI